MRALVTDGNERPALAITRSLGRRGTTVLVGDSSPASLASASKYCAGHIRWPSPSREPEAFLVHLIDLVRRERIDVVIPVTDVTMTTIAGSGESLRRHTAVAAPPFDAFEAVTDKWRLRELAAGCGIPTPHTELVAGPGDLEAAAGRMQFPVVVKPARSRVRTCGGWVGGGIHYAASADELREIYGWQPVLASHPSLVQERIVGAGVGLFVLFDRGELVTVFAHRRLREKPPAGGVSVLCESVPVDPQLRDDAVRLLGPLGWHGVAMLEYKYDCRRARFCLLEVNGRFWGSLQLAIDAGVDFPFLACELACGRRPQPQRSYRIGVRSRWLLGDLDHLLARLFHGRRALNLPAAAPSPVRALGEFLLSVRPGVHDHVLRAGDFGPFRYELNAYVKSLSMSAATAAPIMARSSTST